MTLLLALTLGTAVGCVSDQQVIAQAQDVHGQLEPTVVTEPELANYVQAVGDRIVDAAEQMYEDGDLEGYNVEPWMFENIQFHLVASPVTNAFTTGGTHVYLYSKLFEAADTEDAFAGVVGHEFGHIVGRHVHESMRNQYYTLGAAAGAGLIGAALAEDGKRAQTGATVGGLALAGGQVVGLQFGRDNERQADELGFEFYIRAGYDPEKFANFFAAMLEEQGDAGGGINGFLSSHPSLAERVKTAQERAADVDPSFVQRYEQPPIASPREFARLQDESQPLTQVAARAAAAQQANAFTEGLAILSAFPACVGGLSDDIPPSEQSGDNVVPQERNERVIPVRRED